MNFGFCGTLSAFQNYINDILHEHSYFFFAYIDEIFIYNKTKKSRETHPIGIPKFSKIWFTTGYR